MSHSSKPQLMDREKLRINLARIKKGGEVFEIVVDPDKAVEYKENNEGDITDILQNDMIFNDAQKGMEASSERLNVLFNTSDHTKIAEIIINEGEIQLTTEHREKVRTAKRIKIMNIIHVNAVDPKTDYPHPMTRIENAFEEAKIKIDEFKTAEKQVDEIVKKLRPILPIKFERKEIEIRVPAAYASKSCGMLKQAGNLLKQEWGSDGSLSVVIEIPGGLETDLYDQLNKITHGNSQCRLLCTK